VNPEEKTRMAAGEIDELPPPPPTAPDSDERPLPEPPASRRDSDEADEND
jgi:hypothetical protein